MKPGPFERGPIERMDLVHVLIGAVICLGITELVSDFIWYEFPQFLFSQSMLGVVFFTEYYEVAEGLFYFGLAYLIGGFCGGIYAGYNVPANLKRLLFILAAISTVGHVALAIVFSNFSSTPEFFGLVLLQLAGNALGSYLGGYSINWGYTHEPSGTPGELTLEMPQQPAKP
jgi:phage shock protein PspC (stress-responsive transcriptional regulator)